MQATTLHSRLAVLFRWPFLLGLALLVVNDHVLKQAFPGPVTGKLSDVAGLFVFPLFLATVWPRQARRVYRLTVLGFIWWNSVASQGFIDGVGAWGIYLHRTIDPTDHLTLLVLWPSYRYFQLLSNLPPTEIFSRRVNLGLVMVSVVAFVATSKIELTDTWRVSIGKQIVRNLNARAFFDGAKRYPGTFSYPIPEESFPFDLVVYDSMYGVEVWLLAEIEPIAEGTSMLRIDTMVSFNFHKVEEYVDLDLKAMEKLSAPYFEQLLDDRVIRPLVEGKPMEGVYYRISRLGRKAPPFPSEYDPEPYLADYSDDDQNYTVQSDSNGRYWELNPQDLESLRGYTLEKVDWELIQQKHLTEGLVILGGDGPSMEVVSLDPQGPRDGTNLVILYRFYYGRVSPFTGERALFQVPILLNGSVVLSNQEQP